MAGFELPEYLGKMKGKEAPVETVVPAPIVQEQPSAPEGAEPEPAAAE